MNVNEKTMKKIKEMLQQGVTRQAENSFSPADNFMDGVLVGYLLGNVHGMQRIIFYLENHPST